MHTAHKRFRDCIALAVLLQVGCFVLFMIESGYGTLHVLSTVCLSSILMVVFGSISLFCAVASICVIVRLKQRHGVIGWDALKLTDTTDGQKQVFGLVFFLLLMGFVISIGMCKMLLFGLP